VHFSNQCGVVIWIFPYLASALYHDSSLLYKSYLTHSSTVYLLLLFAFATLLLLFAGLAQPFYRGYSLNELGATTFANSRFSFARRVLLVFQSPLAIILLTGTGLMLQTFIKLNGINLGFDPSQKIRVQILFPSGYDLKPELRLALFGQLQVHLAQLPGVRSVASGQDALLVGRYWGTGQLKMPNGSSEPVAGAFLSANYAETAGLKLVHGHWFSDQRGPIQVVINETMAHRLAFGDSAIGSSFTLQNSQKRRFLS
jgi:hypothetical protein